MENKMFTISLKEYIEVYTNKKNTFSKIKELNDKERNLLSLKLEEYNPLNKDEIYEVIDFLLYSVSNGNKDDVYISFEGFMIGKDTVIRDLAYFGLLELSLDKNGKETSLTKSIKEEYGI